MNRNLWLGKAGLHARRVSIASTFPCPNSQIPKMSTPPPAPADLKSPISSPLPKRTKTAHDSSNGTMASAAPAAASVPVTKVQDGPHLLIKKLSDKAKLPTRGSAFAAGYDLYASKETTIPARGKGLVDTDLSMAVPAGTCWSSLRVSRNHLLTPVPNRWTHRAPLWARS